MAIYEVSADKLRKVEETSFGTAGLGERADLQRLLRDQVTEVSPDTLVIAEEFSEPGPFEISAPFVFSDTTRFVAREFGT